MKIFSKENVGGFTMAGIAIFVTDWIKKLLIEGGSKELVSGLNKKESMREIRQLSLNYIYDSDNKFPKLRKAFEGWNRRDMRPYGSHTKYESGFEDRASSVLTVAFSALCNPVKEDKTGKVIIDKTGEEKYIKLLEFLENASPEQRDNAIETLEYNWKSQVVVRFLEGADKVIHELISFFMNPLKKIVEETDAKKGWETIKIF